MELTPRIKQIIQFLLESEHSTTDQEVADALGVSKRTILREIDYISYILKDWDLELVRKKGEGTTISGSKENKERLREHISGDSRMDVSDKNRRRAYLKLELLRMREPQKLFYFSNMLGVSEATISSDLEAITPWIEESHLSIVKKPGYGIMLSGSEKNYRGALQRFIHENIDEEQKEVYGENIYHIMREDILSGVDDTLNELDLPYLRLLTNNAYLGLLIHLAVAIERIEQGEMVEEDGYDAKYDGGYDVAKTIAEALEERFSVQIPEAEVNNILLHIKGAKLHYSSEAIQRSGIDTEEMLSIIDSMIDTFDPEFAGELKYEEDFIRGLMVHLEPALYRIRHGMVIYNPLLSEIRAEYPEVFKDCEKAAKIITERTGLEVNDAEIGYLAMHFGAAKENIESRKRKLRTVSIGVICASGFGVARLMMAKLKSKLAGRDISLTAYGIDEVNQHVIKKTDFFISGINVDELHVDYVMVSPLITQRDVMQINGKISEYAAMPPKQEDSDFTRQLDEINEMIAKIKGLIRRYHHCTISSGKDVRGVIRFLAEEVTETSKAAAVLSADLIAREQVMSQLFPELGIALFHCKSRAVTECQLVTAGMEGNEHNDPRLKDITAVLCMVMPDDDRKKENGEMLGRISSALIENHSFLDVIIKGEEGRIRDKLQQILKNYFSDHLNEY